MVVDKLDLTSRIYKTAVRCGEVVYAERYINHRKVAQAHEVTEFECGFENTKGVWLDRRQALIVAMYNDQLVVDAYRFLAQRMQLGYDLTDTHPGLDSMWLRLDEVGFIQ